MATAAERRLKVRRANEIERTAYARFMREIGIPLLKEDAMRFERNARVHSKNRHQLEQYILEQAAQIADLAEQQQQNDYGAANTGGAARVAAALRALAGPSKAMEEIDKLFLADEE